MSIRRLIRLIGWTSFTIVTLIVSIIVHLDTQLGHKVTSQVANTLISDLIEGRLHINRIDYIGWGEIEGRHISLFGADNKRVIVAERIWLKLDLWAATRGILRFSHVRLSGGVLRLESSSSGTFTFLDALMPSDKSPSNPDEPPFIAIVDDIRISRTTVYGDFLGLRGLRAQAEVRLSMAFSETTEIHVDSGHAKITEPFPYEGYIDAVSAAISSDPYRGILVYVRAHAGDDQINTRVRYAVPRNQPNHSVSELDLVVYTDNVSMQRLTQSGFDWAGIFLGQARGEVRLQGPIDHLRLNANLEHSAGHIEISGRLPTNQEIILQASSQRIMLNELFAGFPDLQVGGSVELRSAPETIGGSTKLILSLNEFSWAGYAIPSLRVEASLEEEQITITDIEAVYGTGELHGAGVFFYDGRWDLAIKGDMGSINEDPNIQQHAPHARGRLSIALQAHYRNQRTTVTSTGRLSHFSYQGVHTDSASFNLQLDPENINQTLNVDIVAQGASIRGYRLGHGYIQAQGGLNHFTVDIDFSDGPSYRTSAHALIENRNSFMEVNVPDFRIERGPYIWNGHLEHLQIRDRNISYDTFVASAGTQQIESSLRWSSQGQDHFILHMNNFDLSGLRALLGPLAPEMQGLIDLHIQGENDFEQTPYFSIASTVQNVHASSLPYISGDAFARYQDGQLNINIGLDLKDNLTSESPGHIDINGLGIFDATLSNFIPAMVNGTYDINILAQSVNITNFLSDSDNLLDIHGNLSGMITLSGPIFFSPNIRGFGELRDFRFLGLSAFDAKIETNYEYGNLSSHAWIIDDTGPFAEMDSALQIDLLSLIADQQNALISFDTIPWRISFQMPPRLISTWPDVIRNQLPLNLDNAKASLSLTMAGGAFQTRGTLLASIEDLSTTVRPCGNGARPRMDIMGHVENNVTDVEIYGLLNDRRVLTINLNAPTPISSWLQNEQLGELPDLSAHMKGSFEELSHVPILCEHMSGALEVELLADHVWTDHPEIQGTIHSDALRIRRVAPLQRNQTTTILEESDPIELSAQISANATTINLQTNALWQSNKDMSAMAQAYWRWNEGNLLPTIELDAPISANIHANSIPAETVLHWVPGFGRVDGELSGDISLSGSFQNPELAGHASLSNARIDLVPFGQRLRRVYGQFELSNGLIELQNLEAHDGDGSIKINGSVALDGFSPRSLNLQIEPNEFPVRMESSVIGRLSGISTLTGDFTENGLRGNMIIEQLDVELPEESTRSTQELHAHPDITITGRSREITEDIEPFELNLAIDASNKFWVRSQTFSAMVSALLDVHYADPEFRVGGSVEIHRGFFEVFGKRFDVTRGSMAFNGGAEIDPNVSLEAVYSLRSGADNIVIVRASGTLSNPIIEFQSPLVSSGDQGEIIRLLLTGSTNSSSAAATSTTAQDAGEQAADFLAGVAFGVLTLSLREQFGEFVPVIAVETADSGFRSARVRAGFNLGQLLPVPLRRVIQGIYVEGFFTAGNRDSTLTNSTNNNTSATATQNAGFTVELQFPRNIVQRTVYAPDNNFSLDITWEP